MDAEKSASAATAAPAPAAVAFELTPEYIASLDPYVYAILVLTRVFCDAVRKIEKSIEMEENWQETCTRAAEDPKYFPVVTASHPSTLGRLLDLRVSASKSAEAIGRYSEEKDLVLEVLVLLQHAKDEYIIVATPTSPPFGFRRVVPVTSTVAFVTRRFGVIPTPLLSAFVFKHFRATLSTTGIDKWIQLVYTYHGTQSALGDCAKTFSDALDEFARGQAVLRDLESNPKAFLDTLERF